MNASDILHAACKQSIGSTGGANAVTSLDITAIPGKRHMLVGWHITASGPVAATVTGVIRSGGGGVMNIAFQIPAGAWREVVTLPRPIPCVVNENLSTIINALGAGIICTVNIFYFTTSE